MSNATLAVADVIRWIKEMGIVHMVIDPFVSTHTGVSENSNEEIEQVAEALRQIAYETGCSIDLVHHSLKTHSKNTEVNAGDMNAARGASSLIAAARSVYTLSTMNEKTANELGLHPTEAARFVRLDMGKGNYAARDGNVRWFELETFNIGNGGDDTESLFLGDTIAVPKPWQPPLVIGEQPKQTADRERNHAEEQQQILTTVARAMPSDRCQLTEVLGTIKKQFAVKETAARTLIKKAIPKGEQVRVEVGGATYSLAIECQDPSPPYPAFLVRRLVTVQAEAA